GGAAAEPPGWVPGRPAPGGGDRHKEGRFQLPSHGLFTRRRLLGAGAVAGATTLTAGRPAGAAGPAPAQLSPASAGLSKSYPGLSLMAGNELETPPTGTVFVKDPFNGSYPSTTGRGVGPPPARPARRRGP